MKGLCGCKGTRPLCLDTDDVKELFVINGLRRLYKEKSRIHALKVNKNIDETIEDLNYSKDESQFE